MYQILRAFLSRFRRGTSLRPVEAQEALYGAHMRSGQVSLTPNSLYLLTDKRYPRIPAWIGWDTIQWDWPLYGEINLNRHAQDF